MMLVVKVFLEIDVTKAISDLQYSNYQHPLVYATQYKLRMSFGYSVDDFLAVGKITLYLCRAYKGAPAEFDEIRRELSSLHRYSGPRGSS